MPTKSYDLVNREDLVKGFRVLVHTAGGGEPKRATVLDEPIRGRYPLQLQDGTKINAPRSDLEADPDGSKQPTAGVFMKDGVSMQFIVLSGADKESLSASIVAHGGVLAKKEGPDVLHIHAGDDGVIPLCWAGVYSKRLITDAIEPNASFPTKEEIEEKYLLRGEAGSTTSSGGRQKYTITEDRRLLEFVKHNATTFPLKGKKLWEEAEKQKVTARSWQSMREHFTKTLEREYQKQKSKRSRDSEEADDPISQSTPPPPRKKAVAGLRSPKDGGKSEEKDKAAEEAQQVKGDGSTKKKEGHAAGDEKSKLEEGKRGEGPQTSSKSEARKRWKDRYIKKVEDLMDQYRVPKAVVAHAFIIFSGDLSQVEKYLDLDAANGEGMGGWAYEEDLVLVQDQDLDFTKPSKALKGLLQTRSLKQIKARYDWIHHPCSESEDSDVSNA
mmetsp:Transcript_48776/g.99608  ORF Transcript_48776/g.99608 Transcript_48776/m.99608 type:complete len:441 (-) Transcript_48776:450-1772(-)|eukprot:CAMPEP_0181305186 /NCGR_PEP_ID=MMETSP1101-20121128/9581_1 /TAXON_ID=46948 /ORGANISM="Rhodomonas abbreviata, Strain Caron Lab Isolate" /LENGTH=440 /DNA_ID=CAMNT_0023411057 /DNA_START=130 /DNA_END=1452 /DNA_ORIENTATION=-